MTQAKEEPDPIFLAFSQWHRDLHDRPGERSQLERVHPHDALWEDGVRRLITYLRHCDDDDIWPTFVGEDRRGEAITEPDPNSPVDDNWQEGRRLRSKASQIIVPAKIGAVARDLERVPDVIDHSTDEPWSPKGVGAWLVRSGAGTEEIRRITRCDQERRADLQTPLLRRVRQSDEPVPIQLFRDLFYWHGEIRERWAAEALRMLDYHDDYELTA